MAQTIGGKIQGILVGILIALLVLAFAVWGINDVFSPSSRNAVITLGDKEISNYEFEAAFQRQLRTLAQTEGRQMPHQEAYDRGIHNRVLSELLTSKVIEIDADDLGIGVNSKSAIDFVSTVEVFKDELTGKFSSEKLDSVLARQNPRITRAEFEKDIVRDMRQQQTIPAISGGVLAPLEFAEQYYSYLTEQRKAEVLTLTDEAVRAPPEPTDENLQTYIDENPLRFTAPEYRRITLIRLEPTDIIPDLEVTPEEIDDHFNYKVSLGELGSAETRSVIQITAGDEETAKKAVERLNNDEEPAAVSALLDLIEPISYENVRPEGILDPETSKAAFEMDDGAARAILGSLGNWYAIKVTNVTEAEKPNLEDIRPELESELLDSKAKDKIFDIIPDIEDAITEGRTLEEAAEAGNVSYSSIDFVDRTGLTRDGEKMVGLDNIPGIAQDDTILKEIFVNDVGYETDMFETETGGWVTLRVDDIIEQQLRPFDEIKKQATTLWQRQKTNEALDELMLDLAGRAQTGESLAEILASLETGGSLEDTILLRSAPSQSLGQALNAGLLSADVGDIERGPGQTALTRQIGKLTEIVSNKDSLAGQFADQLQDQMTAAVRNDLLEAYQNSVLVENPKQEYPDKVQQALGLDTEG